MAALPKYTLDSRWGRILIENLTAYLFILPAALIIFVFGIFPVAFAFFVSLYKWRRFPEEYIGLENYYEALGSFAYVLFFFTALLMFGYGALIVYHLRNNATWRGWLYLIPATLNTLALGLLTHWFFKALPYILDVPRRLPRGKVESSVFLDEFFNSFTFENISEIGNQMLLATLAAFVMNAAFLRGLRLKHGSDTLLRLTLATTLFAGGAWLLRLTLQAIDTALTTADATGEDLPIWSHIIFIGTGAWLMVAAYVLWTRAVRQFSDRRFWLMSAAGVVLLVGGYLLMVYFPQSIETMDDDLEQGFWVTVLYVIGTVPFQLAGGLGLAYMLFNIKQGKGLFRVLYFLPYITPFAATAVIFSTLFSHRPQSPINRMLDFFGVDAQKWLLEPTPIFEVITGRDLPQLLEGPGLALVVIIIWSIWTYLGYDAVIFMAGLGNISPEYYEAARIDGASGWAIFRHITLPLLSPTTFFLSLIAVIGTFQAFTQMWILRRPSANDAVDTVGVYLFETVSERAEYGYGSAMAFVLFAVILLITLFQNRIMSSRVFYG